MNRFSKLLGICAFVFITAIPCAAQQDLTPSTNRSIGLNVRQSFTNGFPELLYRRTKGRKTLRLRGQLQMSIQSRNNELIPCLGEIDIRNTNISPHLAWGLQWGNQLKWAQFYYGFELRGIYGLYRSNNSSTRNDCNTVLLETSNSRYTTHQLSLGIAGVLGVNFQLTKRFSIAVESDISASARANWTKRYFSQTIYDTVDPISSESRWTSTGQVNLQRSILPTIRVFANLHF